MGTYLEMKMKPSALFLYPLSASDPKMPGIWSKLQILDKFPWAILLSIGIQTSVETSGKGKEWEESI